jgi:hypothetical protein
VITVLLDISHLHSTRHLPLYAQQKCYDRRVLAVPRNMECCINSFFFISQAPKEIQPWILHTAFIFSNIISCLSFLIIFMSTKILNTIFLAIVFREGSSHKAFKFIWCNSSHPHLTKLAVWESTSTEMFNTKKGIHKITITHSLSSENYMGNM